jgi:hypothetical protein
MKGISRRNPVPDDSSLSHRGLVSKVKRVKHAGDEALDQLETLLAQLRAMEGIKEKKRGVFSHRSKAFLHFHEDALGLFVDLRGEDGFTRYSVSTLSERSALLARVRDQLSPGRSTT